MATDQFGKLLIGELKRLNDSLYRAGPHLAVNLWHRYSEKPLPVQAVPMIDLLAAVTLFGFHLCYNGVGNLARREVKLCQRGLPILQGFSSI